MHRAIVRNCHDELYRHGKTSRVISIVLTYLNQEHHGFVLDWDHEGLNVRSYIVRHLVF